MPSEQTDREIEEFWKLILKTSRPKAVGGKELSGRHVQSLFSVCLKSINSGKIPNVNDAWDNMQRDINEESFNKAKKFLEENMQEIAKNRHQSSEELEKTLSELSEITIQMYLGERSD